MFMHFCLKPVLRYKLYFSCITRKESVASVKALTSISCSDQLGFLSNATRHSLEYSIPSPSFIVIKVNGHCVVHFACIINHPLHNKRKVIRISTAMCWLFPQITARLCNLFAKKSSRESTYGKVEMTSTWCV